MYVQVLNFLRGFFQKSAQYLCMHESDVSISRSCVSVYVVPTPDTHKIQNAPSCMNPYPFKTVHDKHIPNILPPQFPIRAEQYCSPRSIGTDLRCVQQNYTVSTARFSNHSSSARAVRPKEDCNFSVLAAF
jgi:hypothetical protein